MSEGIVQHSFKQKDTMDCKDVFWSRGSCYSNKTETFEVSRPDSIADVAKIRESWQSNKAEFSIL